MYTENFLGGTYLFDVGRLFLVQVLFDHNVEKSIGAAAKTTQKLSRQKDGQDLPGFFFYEPTDKSFSQYSGLWRVRLGVICFVPAFEPSF